jgi:Caspase domain
MPQRFAVLIGVNQYDHSSRGAGAPLRAPAHDVADWYGLLRRLDMRDGHVRILTSPDLTAIELGSSAVQCAVANTGTVNAAIDWLAASLAGSGPGAQGILFFAGHGDLRARAGSALYLADYDGTPASAPAGAHGPAARAGVLDLESVRQRVDASAPQATLLAIIDACRPDAAAGATGHPVDGIADTWSTGRHVLVTATDMRQDSYERCLGGRWRGQLTWAATTLLDQWATVRGDSSNRSVGLSFDELVARSGALIAAISDADQPQVPQVYASARGKATAVLAVVGDGSTPTSDQPLEAPGHEWGPGTTGIIKSATGATIGAYQVGSTSAPQSYYWFANGIPNNTSPLTFTSGPLPPPAALANMTRYKSSSPAFGNYNSPLYPGSALFNAAGTVACQFLPTVVAWFKVVGPPAPTQAVYLSSTTALTQSGGASLFQVPANGQIWSAFDSITQG